MGFKSTILFMLNFIKMNAAIVSWYYGDNDFKKYRGYRLSAIDGTVLELNNSERLRK